MLLLLRGSIERGWFEEFLRNAIRLYGKTIEENCVKEIFDDSPPVEIDKKDIYHAQHDMVQIASLLVKQADREGTDTITLQHWISIKKFLCPLPPWVKAPC